MLPIVFSIRDNLCKSRCIRGIGVVTTTTAAAFFSVISRKSLLTSLTKPLENIFQRCLFNMEKNYVTTITRTIMENCDKNNEEQKIKGTKRKKNGCCQESIKHDVIVEKNEQK